MTELDVLLVEINRQFPSLTLHERLRMVTNAGRDTVFTTSLGLEDQVVTAALAAGGIPVRIATLQTGRLFPETLALLDQTRRRFGIDIEEFGFEAADEKTYAARYGLNGFYDSIEARHACCGFRKLKPLSRALEGASVWITGLRREQSDTRGMLAFAERDSGRGLLKVNPLADWSRDRLQHYVEAWDVPVNPLHGRGYPSVGCEPCTRAIRPGEPERAGRWWWENDERRECGLHLSKDGQINPARALTGDQVHA